MIGVIEVARLGGCFGARSAGEISGVDWCFVEVNRQVSEVLGLRGKDHGQ